MWADRVDRLKQLRRDQPRDPYVWVQASELVPDDRFLFGGNWFRVIETLPTDPHVQTLGVHGHTRTVVDYLAFEMVKVMLPRPGTEPV
jgi:hypothetical protein